MENLKFKCFKVDQGLEVIPNDDLDGEGSKFILPKVEKAVEKFDVNMQRRFMLSELRTGSLKQYFFYEFDNQVGRVLDYVLDRNRAAAIEAPRISTSDPGKLDKMENVLCNVIQATDRLATAAAANSNRIENLTTVTAANSNQIAANSNQIAANAKKIDGLADVMTDQVNVMNEQYKRGLIEVNGRVDESNERVDMVDRRMSKNIDKLEQRMSTIERRMSAKKAAGTTSMDPTFCSIQFIWEQKIALHWLSLQPTCSSGIFPKVELRDGCLHPISSEAKENAPVARSSILRPPSITTGTSSNSKQKKRVDFALPTTPGSMSAEDFSEMPQYWQDHTADPDTPNVTLRPGQKAKFTENARKASFNGGL